ncbi:MAG: VOC family protein [Actinobacteria bacterium]|nr:VOC family protein [Actinomycetota bacterium]
MRVRRLGFLGVRTDKVAETTAFFRDVCGLPAGRNDPDWTISKLPTGRYDFVEVFGAGFRDPRVIRDDADGVFVAFFVEDIEEAWRDVEAAGVETLGEIVRADVAFGKPEYAGMAWFFVRGPDGNVYVFQQAAD